jgi:hypothetical protein
VVRAEEIRNRWREAAPRWLRHEAIVNVSRATLMAVLTGALACTSIAPPPSIEDIPPARLRALDFSADIQVAEVSPKELKGEVRVTNRGTTPETLVFADGCPVRLRVYEVRGTRMAPIWESPAECSARPLVLAIAPGESAVLPVPPTNAREILRGELPEDAYRVTVWLAPDDRIVEIETGVVDLGGSR